jgi:hypothetical protein
MVGMPRGYFNSRAQAYLSLDYKFDDIYLDSRNAGRCRVAAKLLTNTFRINALNGRDQP